MAMNIARIREGLKLAHTHNNKHGLRIIELQGLRDEDIKQQAAEVNVLQSKMREANGIIIPLTQSLLDLVTFNTFATSPVKPGQGVRVRTRLG